MANNADAGLGSVYDGLSTNQLSNYRGELKRQTQALKNEEAYREEFEQNLPAMQTDLFKQMNERTPPWVRGAVKREVRHRASPKAWKSYYPHMSDAAARRSLNHITNGNIESLLLKQFARRWPTYIDLSHLHRRLPPDAAYRLRDRIPEYYRRLKNEPSWNLIPTSGVKSCTREYHAMKTLLNAGVEPPAWFPFNSLPQQHPWVMQTSRDAITTMSPEQRRILPRDFLISRGVEVSKSNIISDIQPDRRYNTSVGKIFGYREAHNRYVKKRKRPDSYLINNRNNSNSNAFNFNYSNTNNNNRAL